MELIRNYFFETTGYPIPQYQWFKNGQALTDFSSESFYRILRVQRSDAGSYQCVAKNEIGAIFSDKIDISVACKFTTTE